MAAIETQSVQQNDKVQLRWLEENSVTLRERRRRCNRLEREGVNKWRFFYFFNLIDHIYFSYSNITNNFLIENLVISSVVQGYTNERLATYHFPIKKQAFQPLNFVSLCIKSILTWSLMTLHLHVPCNMYNFFI